MIYTVTLNPAIDYILEIPGFELYSTMRASFCEMMPGGKGINVTTVLNNLGFDSIALGYYAGNMGKELIRMLNRRGIKNDFIQLSEGNTRINVKIETYHGTEINAAGPAVDSDSYEKLLDKIEEIGENDTLVLSGSVSPNLPKTTYADILSHLKSDKTRIVIDATGELLSNTLKFRPFLIKPNKSELEGIFGIKINKREDMIQYAKKLQEKGARNVIVSLAEHGAIFVGENGEELYVKAPEGNAVNAVGAGDSMVAGFIAGYEKNASLKDAFFMSVAAGSASAFSKTFATAEKISQLYNRIKGSN